MTPTDQNRGLIERYFQEIWNEGNIDALDRLLAPGYAEHDLGTQRIKTATDLRAMVLEMRTGISHLRIEVLDLLIAGEKVMAHVRLTGVHDNELFALPATGHRIAVPQAHIFAVRDGRIWRHWQISDDAAFFRQIGQRAA